MGDFKDPARLARVATIILYLYMVLDGLVALLQLASPAFGAALTIAAIAYLFALIACLVVVGCWIYRTNANAHLLSDEMSISPGWAVGWYFVPFANLVKPFQAMKESWMATHYTGNWRGEPTPPLLGWWWGLWLASNFLSNISFQVSRAAGENSFVTLLNLAEAAVNVPLCLILIRLMRRLSRTQLLVHSAEAFT